MKITLHRALSQIKTTTARLDKLIDAYESRNNIYVSSSRGEEDVTSAGRSIEETKKLIQSNFDQFNSLYNNLVELKKAVARANAGVNENTDVTRINVCGKEYTIAELIVTRKTIWYHKEFVDVLRKSLAREVKDITDNNSKVTDRLDAYLQAIAGGDSKKLSSDETAKHTETFRKHNDWKIVDPLNLDEYVTKTNKEIETFMIESDAALSEINALTTIEVDID